MKDDTSLTGIDRSEVSQITGRGLFNDITRALRQVSSSERSDQHRRRIRHDLAREQFGKLSVDAGKGAGTRPKAVSRLRRLLKKQ